jgi:protoporphyrin/coproporphyrin ferrochelatase
MAKTGVLLFNLGGPDTLADVEPFLVKLFSDRDIIELPFGPRAQPLVARLIARVRGPAVRRNYASIGGGSPQLRLTREQAQALEARLNRHADRVRVEVAMRYWRPSTEEALAALAAQGIERIVTLTLYPHYSKATTGSSERELQRVLARPEWQGRFSVEGIDRYPEEPLYLDAVAESVADALASFPEEGRDGAFLLFSAHGLPQKFVDAGDPYVRETEASVRGVLARLGVGKQHALAYQSRTGPVKWIGPGTPETLERLAREGVRDVLVVPISFVGDHIETLYEVDQLFAGDARRAGIRHYRRSAALNSHPLFIEALAGLVERRLTAEP